MSDKTVEGIKLKDILEFLFRHIRKYKVSFLVMTILAYAASIERVYLPSFVKDIIDIVSGAEGTQGSSIYRPAAYAMVLLLIMEIAHRVSGLLSVKTYPRFRSSIREEILRRTMFHSSKFFSREFSGDLASRISDVPFYAHGLVSSFIGVLSPIIFTSLTSVYFLAQINLQFASFYLLWLVLFVGTAIIFGRICSGYSEVYIKEFNALKGKMLDVLSNILSIRLFNRFDFEWKSYLDSQESEIRKLNKSLMMDELANTIFSIISMLQFGTSMIYVLHQWKAGAISAGEISYIFSITTNIVWVNWWFAHEITRVYQYAGYIKQSIALLKTPYDIEDKPDAKPLLVTSGEIVFEDVSFSHSDHKLFDKKNVAIRPGEKIGLVGFSGSGKTTFANLVLREFDPDSGSVLIDGQDISRVKLESLRDQVIYLPQDARLFHRTVRENILFARPDATEDDMFEAARAANAEDFIKNLPKGFDEDVGEGGSRLSGGQRQRISIARAMLCKHSKILILDEITSALDSITEKKIQLAVERLAAGKTVIVIAHRLSTLRMVDRILVFDAGAIIEEGTHDYLVAKGGFYAKFWRSQSGTENTDSDEVFVREDI